jgi:hypothetical protein
VRLKHWGPFDGREPDEHGFPTDPRDRAYEDGALTAPAQAAAAVSRAYLELVLGVDDPGTLDAFLDARVAAPDGPGSGSS